jgi:hypothetical protein
MTLCLVNDGLLSHLHQCSGVKERGEQKSYLFVKLKLPVVRTSKKFKCGVYYKSKSMIDNPVDEGQLILLINDAEAMRYHQS